VVGHFTQQRHIKCAIDASKALVPKLAEKLMQQKMPEERADRPGAQIPSPA